MTTPSTINVNGVRYIQAKEAELNFWVSFFGIAIGIILGVVMLYSLFGFSFGARAQTQTEEIPAQELLYEEVPTQEFMQEEALPLYDMSSDESISV